MTDENASPSVQWIVEQCETDPPNDIDPHPRLWDDYEDDRLGNALFKAWQKGILQAKWNEEDEATRYKLSEFGVELCEKALLDAYVEAMEADIRGIQATPAAVDVINP